MNEARGRALPRPDPPHHLHNGPHDEADGPWLIGQLLQELVDDACVLPPSAVLAALAHQIYGVRDRGPQRRPLLRGKDS